MLAVPLFLPLAAVIVRLPAPRAVTNPWPTRLPAKYRLTGRRLSASCGFWSLTLASAFRTTRSRASSGHLCKWTRN
jgi:hypothetical protein